MQIENIDLSRDLSIPPNPRHHGFVSSVYQAKLMSSNENHARVVGATGITLPLMVRPFDVIKFNKQRQVWEKSFSEKKKKYAHRIKLNIE